MTTEAEIKNLKNDIHEIQETSARHSMIIKSLSLSKDTDTQLIDKVLKNTQANFILIKNLEATMAKKEELDQVKEDLVQIKNDVSQVKEDLSQVKEDLSQVKALLLIQIYAMTLNNNDT